MVKSHKYLWLLITLFVVIEIIFFVVGFFVYPESKQCASCHVDEFQSESCPCWTIPHRGYEMLAVGIIPSVIISIITYFMVKRFSK